VPVCRTCGEENPDRARFCLGCGRSLAPEHAAREVRKTVSVVFADVSGSTDLGERLDPESLRHLMTRYFDAMRTVIERHGGTVEKFIGDAVMAVFGIPKLHEDDALRAVRAAFEMRHALAELNRELERERGVTIDIRTGVNTGEVVAGDPASGQAMVSGDCVNVAARLQQEARPGETLIGGHTYRQVKDAVLVDPVRLLWVKGKDEPIPAFRLVSVTPDAPALARRLSSPMVGRELELRLLSQALARTERERTCHLFTILGSAGVGKSRLAEEFVHSVEHRVTALRGHCLPYGEAITFWPVIEVVRQAASITEFDSADEARTKILALLEGVEAAEVVTDRVEQVIGLREATATTEGNFWAVRRFLEALARERPVVLLFDDANWAEPTFLDLVEHVADWDREAPIMILVLARQELLDHRSGWGGGKVNAASILLEPLTEEESERLLRNLVGSDGLADEVRDRLAEAAEGNPLFLEEMLSMLIDDGLLERHQGRWAATGDLAKLSIPLTIRSLLAARLDRLGEEERDILSRAAVMGKVFHAGSVAELVPEELRPHVPAYLRKLVRKELIRPEPSALAGQAAYRFRHTLLREAAYQALPKEARAELHEAGATWLEKAANERIREYADIVGYHLEQACRYRSELGPVDEQWWRVARRAAVTLSSAGLRSFALGDMPGAISHLSRSVSLLPGKDPSRLALLPELGAALWQAGEFERADAVLGEAIDEGGAAGRDGLMWRASVERAHLRLFIDAESGTEEAKAVAEGAIPVFEREGDDLGLAKAWRLLAEVDWIPCRAAGAEKALERASGHTRRAGDPGEEAEALSLLAVATLFGPTPADEGLRRCEEIRESAADNLKVRAAVVRAEARFHAMLGDFVRARQLAKEARALLEDLGLRLEWGGMAQGFFFVEMLAGDPGAAERELRRGYEILHGLGEKSYLSTLAAMLAHALYAQGRYEEAEQFSRISGEAAGAEDLTSNILWRSARAKVLARRGDLGGALGLIDEAWTLAGKTDFLNIQADVQADRAEVLRVGGRAGEAAEAFQEAARLYDKKGNRVASARAASQVGLLRA